VVTKDVQNLRVFAAGRQVVVPNKSYSFTSPLIFKSQFHKSLSYKSAADFK